MVERFRVLNKKLRVWGSEAFNYPLTEGPYDSQFTTRVLIAGESRLPKLSNHSWGRN